MTTKPAHLPSLDPDSAAHVARVMDYLRARIQAAGGYLPFDDYMESVLYAPGLGYYDAGNQKLAEAGRLQGDFVTAPELTPLFAHTLAQVVQPVLAQSAFAILEFGAGSGALAEGILEKLTEQGVEVEYHILELSADLRARQQQRLARFAPQVRWLEALPTAFSGVVLANEVLDAMPVTLFRWSEDTLMERGVGLDESGSLAWQDRVASAALQDAVQERMPAYPAYISEINLRAEAWVRSLGACLEQGLVLLIDYGFPQDEYYHPQRAGGTLMCHYRHHAHDDPFFAPGVQDLTAHVDFTAMALAANQGGLDVLGYTSQGNFLMNAGLLAQVSRFDPGDTLPYAQVSAAVQKLVSPAEMGELFKVLALGKNLEPTLPGFEHGDRSHRL